MTDKGEHHGGWDSTNDRQLALADDGERLPWLDGDDDSEGDTGFDIWRLMGVALLALLIFASAAGAYWWYQNRDTDPGLEADGSTIKAPPGPYKERPKDRGGKEFELTGNVAPAVGEGQRHEGRLATGGADSAEPARGPASVAVQVGAFPSEAEARAAWVALGRQTDKLIGYSYRVQKGEVDGAEVYRLQAITGDAAGARALCNALKGDGLACQVKR